MLPWASFPVSGHNKDRIYSRVPAQPAPSQLLLRAPLICSGATGFQLILPWRAIVVTGLSLGIEPLECLSGWSPLAIKGNRFPRAGGGGAGSLPSAVTFSGVSVAVSLWRQVSPGCLVLGHPHRPCTGGLIACHQGEFYVLLVMRLEVETRAGWMGMQRNAALSAFGVFCSAEHHCQPNVIDPHLSAPSHRSPSC